MWVLVFINLMLNSDSGYKEPVIESWYEYNTMEECFIARDTLLLNLGSINGYSPTGTQVVCIKDSE
jgi:hypothetical protein